MANRKIELVKNQPKQRKMVARSKSRTTKRRLQPPQLTLAEQVEAERFKVFTLRRAAHQARLRELTETLDMPEPHRVAW